MKPGELPSSRCEQYNTGLDVCVGGRRWGERYGIYILPRGVPSSIKGEEIIRYYGSALGTHEGVRDGAMVAGRTYQGGWRFGACVG